MNDLFKYGSCSIVVGEDHYKDYYPSKNGKLLKITKIIKNHNEFKYLSEVRTIKNYSKYYCIPEEVSYLLEPTSPFYGKLKQMVDKDSQDIFCGTLTCFYIDYAGQQDMLDTLVALRDYNDRSIWDSYAIIFKFIKTVMEGLMYLHQKKICHLDVKPENIMINKFTKTFKIIDFGFASKEPFNDYVCNLKGTPGYFPKHFKEENQTPWLPKIYANDLRVVNNSLPLIVNRQYVYKIDSYCFGRVLYFLRYIFQDNHTCMCFSKNKKQKLKLNNIIKRLMNNDVHTRLTIEEVYHKYL